MNVVTGAAGLVGANLVRALLAQGQPVRAVIHRDRRAVAGLPLDLAEADLAQPASLRGAFAGAGTVYHAAGLVSVSTDRWIELETANVAGTRNVVQACLACGVRRLVFFSSIQALQPGPPDSPIDESRPLVTGAGFPPYDRSKAAAEREVQAGARQGLETVVIYPTAILGPCDFKPSYIGQAVLKLASGRLPGLVKGGFDWVDARDVAAAAIKAGQAAPAGSRFILSGHWHSVPQVAGLVAALTGQPAPRWVAPMGLAWLVAPLMPFLARFTPLSSQGPAGREPLYTRVSLRALRSGPQVTHALATQQLGYQPRTLGETLADALAWFKENGYLQPPTPAHD